MIVGYGPVTQALLGTLLTWGLTAAGAAMVVFLRGNQVSTAPESYHLPVLLFSTDNS